ncbi:condensin complex subunit 3 isoform X2 [Pseudomyrmex gracilis]|nr:condensin complex subunit 3 isoform X2 [Pseudomyrmex gracilis]
MSFYSSSENNEPMSPFLSNLFQFLLTSHNAKDKTVRFRICHFLNMILNSMGDSAFIDDSLCDRIITSMTERLLDKSPKVRVQAVFALHRLQDPSDEHCTIIKLYLFHVSKDPSPEVRKAVLASMGKNQKTLQAALARTRDIDDNVRRMAYEFISKITVRSLTIAQRDCLLKDGLRDRSASVKTYVSNTLLPTWLRHYKGDYINFVHALDAGIGTEAATLGLITLFKIADINTLLEQVPVDKNTRLIPLTNLSNENALYWKSLIQHLQNLSCTDEVELIIPELSEFCTYIREFITLMSSESYDSYERTGHKFILLQLLEISKTYDLSDEVGRKNLKEVMIDTLMSDHCSANIIECIVNHLAKVIPDVNSFLDVIVNVINDTRLPPKESVISEEITVEHERDNDMQKAKLKVEMLELEEELYLAIKEENFLQAESLKEKIKILKEEIARLSKVNKPIMMIDEEQEEKNDLATMVKCLNILYNAIKAVNIHTLTPILKGLMSFVLDSLDHPDDSVHILALKVLSIYCILDKELAKKHIMIFFYQFSLEPDDQEIWIIALKGIFDLLLYYGIECFDILQGLKETSTTQNSTRSLYTHEDTITSIHDVKQTKTVQNNYNFIKILTGLLNNENQDLRTIAAEGLCKLLLNRRINDSNLISRLIILCYNPVNANDDYLRQCLSVFFNQFVTRVSDAYEMLESIYFSTLRVLCKAPDTSPLQEIDPYQVSRFILNLTRSDKGSYIHNNFAFAILAEILNPESEIDKETLVKSLPNLNTQIEDGPSKQNLQEAVKNVRSMLVKSSKRLLKYIHQFQKQIEDSQQEAKSESDIGEKESVHEESENEETE